MSLRAEVVEVPYSGDVLSMFILLPFSSGEKDFNDMVHELTADRLDDVIDSMYSTTVNLQLPKFTIESHVSEKLIKV